MKRTALITGASSGIGRELALIHAEQGGDVVLVARREDALNDLAAKLTSKDKVNVRVIPADLSKEGAPAQIYETLKADGIEIDYLMNNAGFGGRGKFHERDWVSDRSMIQVNIIALTALTRLFLPGFVTRNSGRVLNVSSTASLMPGPLQAVYYATKAYVTFFSNAIAEELHDTDVTVSTLMPGATETEFAKTSGMDATTLFADTASAADVARVGYEGMLAGELDIFAGVAGGAENLLNTVRATPKKDLLAYVRGLQTVDGED